MENKHLIILIIIALICIGIFIYQFNNNVGTFITLNESEISENGSFAGILTDAYGWGVGNKTITYQLVGNGETKTLSIKTDENGKFIIKNSENLDGYYCNFTFNGEGKYQASSYEDKVTVRA